MAASDAEGEGLEGVDGGDDAESKGRPVDDFVLLLSKDTEQVPGQDQGTGYCRRIWTVSLVVVLPLLF